MDTHARDLLRDMLRIRLTEERIMERYPEKEMKCPTHLSIGEEAVAVGVSAALRPEDYVFTNYRGHGHYLAKGGDLRALIAEIYGRATGCAHGKGGSMHVVAPEVRLMGASALVGSGIPLAVGAGLASAIRGDGRVSVAFFGDGAADEGTFHESLNFAVLKKLPVVFVCENNFYAVEMPVREHLAGEIHAKAAAFDLPVAVVADANDVIAVRDAAREAVARARAGGGPTFLECRTFRWRAHLEGYVDADPTLLAERERWMGKCPIRRFRERVVAEGLLTDAECAALERDARAEVDEAFAFARESAYPRAEELLTHV